MADMIFKMNYLIVLRITNLVSSPFDFERTRNYKRIWYNFGKE